MMRLPLDTATDAGLLVAIDLFSGEHGLDGGAEITARDRLVVTGAAVIQLSAIHQTPISIKEIKVRRAGGAISLCNFLCLVMTEW
jgi:hypothetical protein